MPSSAIPDQDTLQREIKNSHERCRQLGENPGDKRNLRQKRLTPEELECRLEQNRDFLNIAIAQIEELYQFVVGAGFVATIVEKDGYILEAIGDSPLIEHLQSLFLLA